MAAPSYLYEDRKPAKDSFLEDVIAGLASEEQLVPFGGEQWHKAFALALGLQLLVDSLHRDDGFGAVLLVARPESDPVPALRSLDVRLPGANRRRAS